MSRRARPSGPARDRTAEQEADVDVDVDRRGAEPPDTDDRSAAAAHAAQERPPGEPRMPGEHRVPGEPRMPGEPRSATWAGGRAWDGDRNTVASAPSAIVLLGGIWLVISRLVYDYPAAGGGPDAVLNGLVIGIAIALIALAQMTTASSNPLLSLVNVALGGWMIASPWVFDYDRWGAGSRPTWSDVITGAAVVLFGLASWAAMMSRVVAMRRPAT